MLKIMRIDDVVDENTLLEFTRQKFGCPAFYKDEMAFKGQCRNWMAKNDGYTYRDLAKVVAWAREKGKRPKHLHTIFHYVNDAFGAGILQTHRANERRQVTDAVFEALAVETDPEWRFRLQAASTTGGRLDALNAWYEHRGRQSAPGDDALRQVEQESLFV